jgi:radical SAM superfamily enzyme YgiQ (UPF0313 family)
MKILFTAAPFFSRLDRLGNPVDSSSNANSMPINALYYLSGLLEAHGHKVRIIDSLDMPKLWQKPDETAALFRGYDAVCISANSFTYWCAKLLLERLAGQKDLPPIILGGAHATHYANHILQTTPVEYAVRGEGERTLIALMEALEGKRPLGQVCNLSYKRGGEIRQTENGAVLNAEELAEMPLPLWEQLPEERYDSLPVESSRGCFFSCTFCSILSIRKWKGIPTEIVLKRTDHAIEHLFRRAGNAPAEDSQSSIFFTDDCFTTDTRRLEELCGELGKRNILYALDARATDLIKPSVMDNLARMRIGHIFIGVECGYEEGLKKVRKGTKIEHVERAAQLLVEHGLSEYAVLGYILAFPWEGLEEIYQTIDYAVSRAARYRHGIGLDFLSYLPGSELYDRAMAGEFGFHIKAESYDRPFYHWETEFFRQTHPQISFEDMVAIDRHFKRAIKRTRMECADGQTPVFGLADSRKQNRREVA